MYITLLELKSRSAYAPSEWDTFLARRDAALGEAPGTYRTFANWSKGIQGTVDDALRRRYAVPFAVVSPATEPDPDLVPETIKEWCTSLFDEKLFRARRDPGAEIPADADLTTEAQRARDAMRDAADPQNPPRPELPLRADLSDQSGVSRGGPLVSTYITPYGFFDQQASLRDERGW